MGKLSDSVIQEAELFLPTWRILHAAKRKKERSRFDEMQEQVTEYHNKYPKVWELFAKFTFDRIGRGFKHYSAKAVFEQIRWETDQANVDPEKQFKVGNNYHSFYARRFMRMYPEHDGFFRTREQTSKRDRPIGMRELGPGDYT